MRRWAAFVLLASMEAGFRIGLRKHRTSPDAERAARGDATLTSILALLGLMMIGRSLLGFAG